MFSVQYTVFNKDFEHCILNTTYENMKTLYVVRHGKACPASMETDDFKRPLTEEGREDAKAMAKRVRKKDIIPGLLMSSPADRALETAHIFAKKLKYPPLKILLKQGIYDEENETLREIVRAIDDSYQTVMLFGHEPALSQFAGFLLQDSDLELRKAGIIGISCAVNSWQALNKGTGRLILFDFPVRATPKMYKKARKALANDITATMEDILEGLNGQTSQHVQSIIKKTSKKFAKEMTKVLHASKIEEIASKNIPKRIDNTPKEQTTPEAEETTESQAHLGEI